MPRTLRPVRIALAILAATVAAGGGAATGAAARGTLDQSLEASMVGPDYAIGDYGGDEFLGAQTFTAGLSGRLDTVAVPLWSAGEHGRYDVDIQGVTVAGAPNGTVLAHGTVDTCRVLVGGPWTEVALPATPAVVAGQRYAVVVARNPVDPLGASNGVWRGATTAYAGGTHFGKRLSDPVPDWAASPVPAAFRTYVSATAPAMSASDVTDVQLSASSSYALTGRDITFTATVANREDPQTTPTGTVIFYHDGAADAGRTLDGNGEASYTTSFSSAGNHHSVGVAYCPSSKTFSSSEAKTALSIVDRFPSATAVTVAPDPTVAGQDATFDATASAVAPATGTPTGSVQFTESDGTPIGPPQALEAGKATLVASAGAGITTVHANYSGDGAFADSTGSVGQTVNRAETGTTITSDTNPVVAGKELSFTITVATLPPGGVQPAGSVAVIIDGQDAFGPIPVFDDGPTAAGVIVTAMAPPTPQSATIGALYSGDADTQPSSAATFTQTVLPAPTTTTTRSPPSNAPLPPATPALSVADALKIMASGLVDRVKRDGFGALTKTRQAWTAIGPGTLTQRVYTPAAPKSALATRTKPVLIARTSKKFAAAGTATLKLRLTAGGRRATKTAKSLKIAIVTRFAPEGGSAVLRVDRLTVKRRGNRANSAHPVSAANAWGPGRLQRPR